MIIKVHLDSIIEREIDNVRNRQRETARLLIYIHEIRHL